MSIDRFHNPARNPGESFDDYRRRRAQARRHADALVHRGLGTTAQQRQRPSARQQLRDAQRANGKGPKGVYSLGLLTKQQRDNRDRLAARFPEAYDEHGRAITLVGRLRVSRADLAAAGITPNPGVVIALTSDHATIRRAWTAGVSSWS